MEQSKGTKNIADARRSRESIIPKPLKISSATGTSSKPEIENKTTERWKNAAKAAITSSKETQPQVTNFQRNFRPMSIAKISKDVMKQLESEHLKSIDQNMEYAACNTALNEENATRRAPLREKSSQKPFGNLQKKTSASDLKPATAFGGMRLVAKKKSCYKSDVFAKPTTVSTKDCQEVNPLDQNTVYAACNTVLDKENTTKGAPLKEKSSQKPYSSLQKKTSASDLKPATAFGGMRLVAKKKSCYKSDVFAKPTTVSTKDCQEVNPLGQCAKELKTIDSDKTFVRKEIDPQNDGNTENSTMDGKAKSSTAASLPVKETINKKYLAFGAIRFSPKWISTPIRPELYPNKQIEFRHDEKELHFAAKWLSMTPASTKVNIRKNPTQVNVGETNQPPTKGAECLKIASPSIVKAGEEVYTAFGGLKLTPKIKSTHPKPDSFENMQNESKKEVEKSVPTEPKNIHVSKKVIEKIGDQNLDSQTLEIPSTQKPELSNKSVPTNVKEVIPKTTAFGGIRFKPRQKNLRDKFETHKDKIVFPE